MITEVRKSVYNRIIEQISDSINIVVQNIANDTRFETDAGYQGSWKQRYPSIKDLDVLTATHVDDYLPTSIEYPERYPAVAFYIDAAEPSPAMDDSECFLGRLGYELYVQGENFKMAQRELFEIADALRSIILHDKSVGVINGLGGLLDQIQSLGFSDFYVDQIDKRQFIVGARFSFMIAFREDYNR